MEMVMPAHQRESNSEVMPDGPGAAPQAWLAAYLHEGRAKITPKLARLILDHANYAGQRRPLQAHVATLVELIGRGNFTQGTQIAFGRTPDDGLHLVNGQHRLLSVEQSRLPQEFQILIVPAADASALEALYYRFDTVQRARSTETILSATNIAEKNGIPKMVMTGLYTAVTVTGCGLRRVNGNGLPPSLKTPDGRIDAMMPFLPQAKIFSGILKDAEGTVRRRLTNATIIAVAMVTLRDQPEKATEFWRGVATNSGLERGDPRRTLVLSLLDRDLMAGNEAINLTCQAWNAWYRGRQLTLLRTTNGTPVAPLGCKVN